MFDELTQLGNNKYLLHNYKQYIDSNNNSNTYFVMIDFSNFKKINDTYGHDVGDKCLVMFAEKLRVYFKNSLLIRLHGDEFVVITTNNEKSIENLLNLISLSIDNEVNSGIIPLKFDFNAGCVIAEKDIDTTKEKADYMMYYAKKKKQLFALFDGEIYQKHLNEKDSLDSFKEILYSHKFSYYGRNLFTKEKEETNNVQIYTRYIDGNNILEKDFYKILRNNSQISNFDVYNLSNIIEKVSMIENCSDKYIINVDYKSLLSIKELLPFLKFVNENTISGLNNLILSIDIFKIEVNEFPLVIEIINKLSEIGLKIKLDKINNLIADYIVEETNPDFLKIEYRYWKKALDDEKKKLILQAKLDAYKRMADNVNIIFDQVETESEVSMLNEITLDNSLFLGEYYSKERKLILF